MIKSHFLRTKSHLLPASNYAAMRANHVLAEHARRKQGKKKGCESGPKGVKVYGLKEQERLAHSAAQIQAQIVEGAPA